MTNNEEANRVAEYLRRLADEEAGAHTPRYVFIPVMLRHAAGLVERIAQETTRRPKEKESNER